MKEFTCIVCPMGCRLKVEEENNNFLVTGNNCIRGEKYAVSEMTNPVRTITTTMNIDSNKAKVVPVKSNIAVPKDMIFDIVKEISKITLKAPVKIGDVAVENILGTNANIIVTKNVN